MLKKTAFMIGLCLFFSQIVFAAEKAKIIKIRGDVKIRRGLEETWQPAHRGMSLDIIDSILILEGEVTLKIREGLTFKLGSNSMLDIADLRKITKKEMFLFLMSEKVDKIPQRKEKSNLKIGNVSIVHGESKGKKGASKMNQLEQKWQQELNGAKAMYNQGYYPNTIVKLHKIRKKYPSVNDFGEIPFYLGKAFEEMNENGQAVDAYQIGLEQSKNCDMPAIHQLRREAKRAIKQLIK